MTSTAPRPAPEPASVGGMLEEISPLVGFVAQAGPPPFVLAGALVFGSLMLAGPFAVAVTLVVAVALIVVSIALLAAAVVAIVAAPYALLRRARRFGASHPFPHVGHRARALRAGTPVVARRAPLG
jgi:hypothetical protein